MIYQSIEKKLPKINVNNLVTEEDVLTSEDYGWGEGDHDEKVSQATGATGWVTRRRRFTEEQAVLLIQKMWRGYQTRKLVNRYVKLMSAKRAAVEVQNSMQRNHNNPLNETKKYNQKKKHGRRLSDLVDMEKTQKINTGHLK